MRHFGIRRSHNRNASVSSSIKTDSRARSSNVLWMTVVLIGVIQLILMSSYNCTVAPTNHDHHLLAAQDHSSNRRPISSFWWPSPETSGGFLSAIYRAQHPKDCQAKSTKFFVMQSLKKNEGDNRGLSAWASITMQLMLHAFSDGDNFEGGRRVLINDNKLWPMAKGCKHDPQQITRECYFLPLTNCKLSDVDPIDAKDTAVLNKAKDEYDHTVRTLYSSDTSKYTLLVDDKFSWSGLPGSGKDHSQIPLVSAFLAYYLRPQPWLQKEIDLRLRRSIPSDLDPSKTVGVPIRRSDKCFGHKIVGSAGGELDCPALEDYLDAVKNFTRFDPLIRNIIVTSEDKSACLEFVELVKKELPSLRVVLNVGDVQQGTGSASKLEAYEDSVNNADVVASALTSFHMQMRSRYFVVTTKSSWTSSIAIFARVYGFAASSDIYVIDIGRNRNNCSDMARKG